MNESVKRASAVAAGITVERILLLLIVVLQAAILWNLVIHDRSANRNREGAAIRGMDMPAAQAGLVRQGGASPVIARAGTIHRVAPVSPAMMIEDMESIMDTVLADFETMDRFMNPPRGWGAFEPTPALDMHESPDRYTVVFTVLGLDADSIRVGIEGRTLSVTGSPTAAAGGRAPQRSFESRVHLPGPVGDIADAEAFLTNGLLRVSLPKAFPSRPAYDLQPVILRLR